MGILRSGLIFVSAVALLLAGFARTGGVIGLWDPVQAPSAAHGLSVQILHSGDARAAAQAGGENPPKPGPPVSVRSALLVALASAALALLLTAGSRAARWLSDVPYLLRTRPATRFRGVSAYGALASPVLGRAVRSRARHTAAGRIRLPARSIRGESLETLVVFVLSGALGVALGILVAFYAG